MVVGAEAVRGVAQPHDLRVDLEGRTDGMSSVGPREAPVLC